MTPNSALWASASCLALLLAPVALAQPVPVLPSGCAPLVTGPDVEEQLCHDLNDPGCPLYTLARYKDETGWHKHCVGQ
ncbi:MAG: hypothetical protein QOI63_719 [Thermoplasmata archaeon]|jgi:hypothetical protein|nr:hypothetical protein [Thermoplasmata archaeon]